MKISGFTIARNVIKYQYPILESIRSILPICDEFIINVGDSEDDTLKLLQTLKSDKIKFIFNDWDFLMGKEVLSHQTNLALKECSGDWAFYLQSDEVIYENDLSKLKKIMQDNVKNEEVDAIRFRWLHFYGSYYRYRIDAGWYQKQNRIIRNNDTIESCGDAFGFQKKNGLDIRRFDSRCLLYHYGWVQPQDIMMQRRLNAEQIGFVTLKKEEKKDKYNFGDLNRFPAYFGSHPATMNDLIRNHTFSQEDKKVIDQKFWWHPMKFFNVRYKTGKRVRKPIQ